MMKIFTATIASLLIMVGLMSLSPKIYAEDVFESVCKKNPNATVCKEKDLGGKNPVFGPDSVTAKIINLLSFIVGVAAVIGIMLGGLKFILGGDNPQEVAAARNIIIYAVVGIVIALSSQLIVRVFLYRIGD